MFTLHLQHNHDTPREVVTDALRIAKLLNVYVTFVYRTKVITVHPDTDVESKVYDMEHIYFY